ncbi:MAG: right-handed parallel beta-helix repeat-containing protein, partial [Armatimonadetes bacterium]|nr:right-handed parallel beta-helix repeat-containing protein [Armatimonadota bacterium]
MTTRTPGLFLTALLVAAISVMLGGCNGTTSLPGPSFAPSPQSQTAATFWVSPVGNDAAEGTFSAPFQTLERARQAVRTVTPNPGQDIVVNLRGGTYRMGGSFILTPEDSGRNGGDVVYRAAPGEHPVLSGATRVENWSLADASLNIYRAYVGDRLARQLYVNGKRGIRARTEDVPSGFLPAYVYVPGGNGHGEPEPISPNGIEFIPTALNPARWSDPSTWTNVTDIESVCVTQWKMMRVPLASVTPYIPLVQTGLIVMQEPAWFNANLFLIEYLLVPGPWSMWQATWFENAYEFLDEPGEFYLNRSSGYLYYIPRAGENLATADVELPSIEVLVDGLGDVDRPIKNLRFEGLTFTGATWLGPSSANGYVCDQSGFFLTGYGHQPNVIGHNPNDERTLGNVKFRYAHNIKIIGNIFEHLGGAALDFDTGCQNNTISDNLFEDIASTGIVLGGISPIDAHPVRPEQVVRDNTITNNNLRETGRDYVDTAAIYLGFTTRTLVSHNSIYDCPWSGIAI